MASTPPPAETQSILRSARTSPAPQDPPSLLPFFRCPSIPPALPANTANLRWPPPTRISLPVGDTVSHTRRPSAPSRRSKLLKRSCWISYSVSFEVVPVCLVGRDQRFRQKPTTT